MEHIVQFGISIDDEVIKQNIEKNVQGQVVGAIKADAMRALCGKKDVTSYEYRGQIEKVISDTANTFFDLHKEEIIADAARLLAEKLAKTKAVKDAVNKALEDVLK